jgi:hypothetical protein
MWLGEPRRVQKALMIFALVAFIHAGSTIRIAVIASVWNSRKINGSQRG